MSDDSSAESSGMPAESRSDLQEFAEDAAQNPTEFETNEESAVDRDDGAVDDGAVDDATWSEEALGSFSGSIYTSEPLPPLFIRCILELERELGLPVWLLIQSGGEGGWDYINFQVNTEFELRKFDLPSEPIALVVHSPGGVGGPAYRLATLFQTRCNGFTAVVPRYAKSAATLLCLGAQEIIMGDHAELGPLDAQVMDIQRERRTSALDEVQSLERLHQIGLQMTDVAMNFLYPKTGKRIEVVLPIVLRYVADMMAPLLADIDAVEYSQRARSLKVAQEYAVRLLVRSQSRVTESPESIARLLVEVYPEHGFVIDRIEAKELGLGLRSHHSERLCDLLDILASLILMGEFTVIGRLQQEQENGAADDSCEHAGVSSPPGDEPGADRPSGGDREEGSEPAMG